MSSRVVKTELSVSGTQLGDNDQGLFGPRLRGSLDLGVGSHRGSDPARERARVSFIHAFCMALRCDVFFSSAHDNTKFVSSGGDRSVFL